MSSRHLARSIAMQSLFEQDFNEAPATSLDVIVERNAANFGPGLEEIDFVKRLVNGVVKHRKKIDGIIEKAAPEWPIDQISIVDRNILRIGLYELLYGSKTEVPPKVAINEAIELGKNFGGESSGKFINGVLGTIYRELGEPGKDQSGKKKFSAQDLEKLPREELGGMVVYHNFPDGIKLALVHDVFGYWTLSKGHLESGENLEQGTIREIKEEIGVDVIIEGKIGDNEYIASDIKIGPVRRHVVYYLAYTSEKELKLESSGGLDNTAWFSPDELPSLTIYDDIRPLIKKGLDMIQNKDEKSS